MVIGQAQIATVNPKPPRMTLDRPDRSAAGSIAFEPPTTGCLGNDGLRRGAVGVETSLRQIAHKIYEEDKFDL